jgi:unsaturated rhamnogalacturonyl hydrolase
MDSGRDGQSHQGSSAGMAVDKKRLAGYLQELIDSCLKFQRLDGLFHDVLDDPKSFIETNLAQMLAYTIFRGIQGGGSIPNIAR